MPTTQPSPLPRIVVFVDYWNFQLTLNQLEASAQGLSDYRFKVDWAKLGPWLAKRAFDLLQPQPAAFSFDGVHIYASHNPQTVEGRKFKNWALSWLDRQPGIRVACRERKPKALPKCPSCFKVIEYCPQTTCGKRIVATIEKGVDTLIATDMIRLAWEQAYDVAVLATSDSDLVPAVEFIISKGVKVVQAGFPPLGVDLATACFASFDVFARRAEIARP